MLPVPVTMPPERADYLRANAAATLAALLDLMTADLLSPGSTDSLSASERLMLGAIRPWLPKLRAALVERLSATDPVALERLMSAAALGIESVLWHAPGEPLPPAMFARDPAGRIALVDADAPV